jgi:hypothetical protein
MLPPAIAEMCDCGMTAARNLFVFKDLKTKRPGRDTLKSRLPRHDKFGEKRTCHIGARCDPLSK